MYIICKEKLWRLGRRWKDDVNSVVQNLKTKCLETSVDGRKM